MARILVVEDSKQTQLIIETNLQDLGDLDFADNAEQAVQLFNKNVYDLIIFDVNLPDGNGYQLCSQSRSSELNSDTQVIFLTCNSEIQHKATGFAVGADDYVTKPFSNLELRMRAEAKLRRQVKDQQNSGEFVRGPLKVNTSNQKAYIQEDNHWKDLGLTPIEFRLLALVAKTPEQVYDREAIMNSVWGEGVHVTQRSIDSHISNMRRKLGPLGVCMQSRYGAGYRFIMPSGSLLDEDAA